MEIRPKCDKLGNVLEELRSLMRMLPGDERLLWLIEKLESYIRCGESFEIPKTPLRPSCDWGFMRCNPSEPLENYRLSDWQNAIAHSVGVQLCTEEMYSAILSTVMVELMTKAKCNAMDAYNAVLLSNPADLREKLMQHNCKVPWFFMEGTIPMYIRHPGNDMYDAFMATACASLSISLFKWGDLTSVTSLNGNSKLKGFLLIVYKI